MKVRWGLLWCAVISTSTAVLAAVGPAAQAADVASPVSASVGGGAERAVADWRLQSPRTSPPIAQRASMTFDSGRGKVVMFGGTPRDLEGSDETWTWDGKTWEQLQTGVSPLKRMNPALAYDPVRDETIMFGGYNQYEGFLNDTWVLRGSKWTRLTPTTVPAPRVGATMAYDPHLGQLLMFGGCCSQQAFDETWTWNGKNWVLLHPAASPTGRHYAGLAYDPSRDALVLFGGVTSRGEPFDDTWRWDGSTWVEETLDRQPSTWYQSGVATFGRHLIEFGGVKGETWILRDNSWRRLRTEVTPPARLWVDLTWDPMRRQVLLYGQANSTDTWTVRPKHHV